MKTSDVIIIGGGPSGLATALSLKKESLSINITIIEKSEYDKFRHGETVPNKISQFFKQLDIWEAFQKEDHLPDYGKNINWSKQSNTDSIFEPNGSGWHLDRPRFDKWLSKLCIEAGINIISGATINQIRIKEGLITGTSNNNQSFKIKGRFIINATGHSGLFKSENIQSLMIDQMMTAYFEVPAKTEKTFTSIATAKDGWWYQCNLRKGKSVFAFCTDSEIVKKENLKRAEDFFPFLPQGSNEISNYFKQCVSTDKPNWITVKVQRNSCIGENWLATGDSAAIFDPLAGQGIYKAFETGILAAYATINFLSGDFSGLDKYNRIIKGMFETHFEHRLQYYNMVAEYPDSVFWKNRQMRLSLHPQQQVVLGDEKPNSKNLNYKWVSESELHTLITSCQKQISAAKLVETLASDQNSLRTILAIQKLIDSRIMKKVGYVE